MRLIGHAIFIAGAVLAAGQGHAGESNEQILATYKAERAALEEYLEQERTRVQENKNLAPTSAMFRHQKNYCKDPRSCRCGNPILKIEQALWELDIRVETVKFNSRQAK